MNSFDHNAIYFLNLFEIIGGNGGGESTTAGGNGGGEATTTSGNGGGEATTVSPGGDCADEYPEACPDYVMEGDCNNDWKDWMAENCKASCNLCDGGTVKLRRSYIDILYYQV